jgi:alpha-galactosidase
MAKNLKYLGYEYIVIDMLWYGDEAASDFEAFVHETIPARPNYNLDEYGRLLPETDFQTMALLTNEEALAVNRNSINPRQIKFKNAIVIWASDIPDTEDKYLAFFNQWESKEPINIKVQFKDLGLPSEAEFNVRDLWAKKDLCVFKNSFGALIPSHGAGLYRISRK